MRADCKLRLRRTLLNWRWLLVFPGLVVGIVIALPVAWIGIAARGYLALADRAYLWAIERITP